MLLLIDEEVNLYKINNRVARENNYEKLLSMFNDIMQGKAEFLGVIVGGTPQAVEDERRGLFSYEALRTRLESSRLVRDGLTDYSSPIIKLNTLTNEEIYLLLERLMDVFCAHYKMDSILNQGQMEIFMNIAVERLGADQLLTPREVTRDFIALLNLLRQNPSETFESLTQTGKVQVHPADYDPDELSDDEFVVFNEL